MSQHQPKPTPLLVDPVLSRLEAALEPWPLLLAIADRLEELGEDRLAWAYRWLAEHKKWPVLDKDLWCWAGYGDGERGQPSDCLPLAPAQWLQGRAGTVGRHLHQFDTLAEALRMAATAVAGTMYTEKVTP